VLELNFNTFTGAMPTLLRGGVQRRPHGRRRDHRQEDGSGGLTHLSFIHRDLNNDLRAKVSDFGLVKLLVSEGTFHSMETRIAGTFGYRFWSMLVSW
jgi:hypothetical protein